MINIVKLRLEGKYSINAVINKEEIRPSWINKIRAKQEEIKIEFRIARVTIIEDKNRSKREQLRLLDKHRIEEISNAWFIQWLLDNWT